jgi:hypothetical protein
MGIRRTTTVSRSLRCRCWPFFRMLIASAADRSAMTRPTGSMACSERDASTDEATTDLLAEIVMTTPKMPEHLGTEITCSLMCSRTYRRSDANATQARPLLLYMRLKRDIWLSRPGPTSLNEPYANQPPTTVSPMSFHFRFESFGPDRSQIVEPWRSGWLEAPGFIRTTDGYAGRLRDRGAVPKITLRPSQRDRIPGA